MVSEGMDVEVVSWYENTNLKREGSSSRHCGLEEGGAAML